MARLLAGLHPDPEEAVKLYGRIRSKLETFFRYNRQPDFEDLASETFTRVLRSLEKPRPIDDLQKFIWGVAQNLLKESFRAGRRLSSIEEVPQPEWDRAVSDPQATAKAARTMECMKGCLGRLPAADRTMIVEYYQYDRRERIVDRQRMAKSLGLSTGALSVRAYRIRKQLEECVGACMDAAEQ